MPWHLVCVEHLESKPRRQCSASGRHRDERTQRGLGLSDGRPGDLGLRNLRNHFRHFYDSRWTAAGQARSAIRRHFGRPAVGRWVHLGRPRTKLLGSDCRVRCLRRYRDGIRLRGGHAGGSEMVWSRATWARRGTGGWGLWGGGHLHFSGGQISDRKLWHLRQFYWAGNLLRNGDRLSRTVAGDSRRRLPATLLRRLGRPELDDSTTVDGAVHAGHLAVLCDATAVHRISTIGSARHRQRGADP